MTTRLRCGIFRGMAKLGVGLAAIASLLSGSMNLHAQERIKPTCVETQTERKCWVDHGPSTGPKISPVNPPPQHVSHLLEPPFLSLPLLNAPGLLTSILTEVQASAETSFLLAKTAHHRCDAAQAWPRPSGKRSPTSIFQDRLWRLPGARSRVVVRLRCQWPIVREWVSLNPLQSLGYELRLLLMRLDQACEELCFFIATNP